MVMLNCLDAEVILHIGAPKTGSSAIQKLLSESSALLLSQGIYYPQHDLDPNGVSGGHWQFANKLKSGDFEGARLVFERYLQDARSRDARLLLSAESFIGLAAPFLDLLKNVRFCVVAFFRHPLEAFISSYGQDVKRHFLTLSVNAYACTPAHSRPAVTGESLLEWADYIGAERMIVLPYEELDSFDATASFLSLFGMDLKANRKRINLGYTPCALELKRLLNRVIDRSGPINRRIDLSLQAYSDTHFPVRPSVKCLLNDEIYLNLCEYYSSFLAQMYQKFNVRVAIRQLMAGEDYETLESVWAILASDGDFSTYVFDCLQHKISAGELDYDILELCRLVGLDFDAISGVGRISLDPKLVQYLVSEGIALPDVYRELARIVDQSGDSVSALLLARRALRLRPGGTVIRSMVEKLDARVRSIHDQS